MSASPSGRGAERTRHGHARGQRTRAAPSARRTARLRLGGPATGWATERVERGGDPGESPISLVARVPADRPCAAGAPLAGIGPAAVDGVQKIYPLVSVFVPLLRPGRGPCPIGPLRPGRATGSRGQIRHDVAAVTPHEAGRAAAQKFTAEPHGSRQGISVALAGDRPGRGPAVAGAARAAKAIAFEPRRLGRAPRRRLGGRVADLRVGGHAVAPASVPAEVARNAQKSAPPTASEPQTKARPYGLRLRGGAAQGHRGGGGHRQGCRVARGGGHGRRGRPGRRAPG